MLSHCMLPNPRALSWGRYQTSQWYRRRISWYFENDPMEWSGTLEFRTRHQRFQNKLKENYIIIRRIFSFIFIGRELTTWPANNCLLISVLWKNVICSAVYEIKWDMILALAGQFKQLSHEPEKFRWLNGIRTHDLCDAGAVLSPTELWSHTVESRSICWAHVFPWKECHMKECYMQCGVWNQMRYDHITFFHRNVICSAVYEIKWDMII